jgi:hypothetical protein
MSELTHVRLSGDVEGDYVVLQPHAGGILRSAPEQPEGLPKVVALEKTCTACPSQWEGTLEDGRMIYARYRHGALSVGIGDDPNEAVHNSMTDQALLADYPDDRLDGFMDFEELKVHLHGLLEFPADLVVENEGEPDWDPEQIDTLFTSQPSN